MDRSMSRGDNGSFADDKRACRCLRGLILFTYQLSDILGYVSGLWGWIKRRG